MPTGEHGDGMHPATTHDAPMLRVTSRSISLNLAVTLGIVAQLRQLGLQFRVFSLEVSNLQRQGLAIISVRHGWVA